MLQENPVAMLNTIVSGKQAWTCASLQSGDWLFKLDDRCRVELETIVGELRTNPLPVLLLTPDLFEFDACRALMWHVREVLNGGISFAVFDRLPVDAISVEEAKTLYWLLPSLIARPVAQKLDGAMIYDVHDTGMKALPGSGIRLDKNNVDLSLHNDNAL